MPKICLSYHLEHLENNDGVLDEPTASVEAGGSGIERATLEKATQFGRLIEARMDPCLELLGWTWDDVLPDGMTVGELREHITKGLGPILLNEQENLPGHLMQVFRRLRAEKLSAKNAQPTIANSLATMTSNFASYIRSTIVNVRTA